MHPELGLLRAAVQPSNGSLRDFQHRDTLLTLHWEGVCILAVSLVLLTAPLLKAGDDVAWPQGT